MACFFFFFQAEDGIRDYKVTGVQTCALPISDPANLGSILRSADALGWEGVLVPEHRSVGITPAVRKVSAGAVERVPVVRTGSPAAAISLLQERHAFGVVGLDPAATVDYHEADYPERTCLVV